VPSMKLRILTRKVHYWSSIVIVAPLLVIITTGLLLQLKKNLSWVQPPEQRGSADAPSLSLSETLAICQGIPGAGIRDWSDIPRLEVRPARGLIKVVSATGIEIQLDAATGDILQVAQRRSDLIEALHDGSWFHPHAKLWVFLPSALVLLGLLLTGIYLFILPFWARRRGRAPRAEPPTAAPP
jgi:uncharacterized iron-regulated membrane protein